MRRMRLLAAMVAVLTVMAFGAGAAHAYWGWYWNAEIDLEGTVVHTQWSVDGDQGDYFTDIRVSVPRGADADILAVAGRYESVSLRSRGSLSCDVDSVEAVVSFKVNAADSDADFRADVEVSIVVDGDSIATATGRVGKRISVTADVPVSDPGCWEGDEDDDDDDDDDEDDDD